MWIPALLAATLALLPACSEAPRPPRPDVLLITLDTLRADHLGVYGAPAGSTPALDALAARGVIFERMLAASSRTAPSHASLFTSRWVRDHAIGHRNGSTRLDDETTLASRLAAAGYRTAAFVSNTMLRRRIGLDAGFAHYDDSLPDSEPNRPVFERIAEKTTARALAWLARPRSGPRFVWVQYNDPHGPYTPPPSYLRAPPGAAEPPLPVLEIQRGLHGIPAYQALPGAREPRQYRARYAAEIRYLDDQLARLVAAFEEQAEDAGRVVAVTADHGESLGEEDIWFSHGFGTTPNLAHVPFLLLGDALPAGRRVEAPVHHVDVAPTLLALAGLPVPEEAAGRPLAAVARGEAVLPEDRPLYVDVGAEVSVYRGDLFVRARFGEDLGEAPHGSRRAWRWSGPSGWEPLDGTSEEAEEAAELAALAVAYDRERAPLRLADAPGADERWRLRALGYLEPEAASGPGSLRGSEPQPDSDGPR